MRLLLVLFYIIACSGEVIAVSPTPDEIKKIIREEKKQIWHDIKVSSFYKLDPGSNLSILVNNYHQIEKTDRSKTKKRIAILQKISSEVIDQMEQGQAKNIYLRLLAETASRKAIYLEHILTLRDEAYNRSLRLAKTPEGASIGRGVGPKYFEDETVLYLDPGHRSHDYLLEKFIEWRQLLDQNKNLPDFYFWLEGQEPTKKRDEYAKRHTRIGERFFEDRLIIFDEEGKAYSRNKRYSFRKQPIFYKRLSFYQLNLAISNQKFHYNIDPQGRLYVFFGPGPHSRVLHGKTILAAGMISFKDAKITYIDNNSGHYAPSAGHLQRSLKKMIDYYKNPKILSEMKKYGINEGSGVKVFDFTGTDAMKHENNHQLTMSLKYLSQYRRVLPTDEIKLYFQDSNDGIKEKKLSSLFDELDKSDLSELPHLRQTMTNYYDKILNWRQYFQHYPSQKKGLGFTQRSEQLILGYLKSHIKEDASKIIEFAARKDRRSIGWNNDLKTLSKNLNDSEFLYYAFASSEGDSKSTSQTLTNLLRSIDLKTFTKSALELSKILYLPSLSKNFESIAFIIDFLGDFYGVTSSSQEVKINLYNFHALKTYLPLEVYDQIKIKYSLPGKKGEEKLKDIIEETSPYFRQLSSELDQITTKTKKLEFFLEPKLWIEGKRQPESSHLFYYQGANLIRLVFRKDKEEAVKIQERQAMNMWKEQHKKRKATKGSQVN